MHSWILQTAVAAAVIIYLGRWRFLLHQRRRESWDELLTRLTPGWQEPLGGQFSGANGDGASGRGGTPAKLWNLSRNAKTMQEIADYALRNFEAMHRAADQAADRIVERAADRAALEELHRDATCLRFLALADVVSYAFGRPVKTLG